MIKILFLILFLPLTMFGQAIDYSKFKGEDYKTPLMLQVPGTSFLKYKKGTIVNPRFPNIDSVKIVIVEDVIAALASANNLKWYSSYFENPSQVNKKDKDLVKVKTKDSTSHNFELLGKMTIKRGGEEKTIVKLVEKIKGSTKSKPEVMIFKKSNSGWLVSKDKSNIEEFYFLMDMTSPEVLDKLFDNEVFSDKTLDELRIKTRTEVENQTSNLDITKLIKIINQWQAEKAIDKLQKINNLK